MTLHVRSVSAGYGTGDILTDISISLGAGEAVGVLGANGAGKTTMIRMIMDIIRPRFAPRSRLRNSVPAAGGSWCCFNRIVTRGLTI